MKTLAQLIYAQNFSMPAGYVQDQDGESWLLKVGEEYDSVKDISGALLLHVEGYGDVRLSDVADVEVIDNSADSYTRLNGEKASILKIYKNATSSAGEVSDNCLTAFKELEKQYDGLHMVVLSNQGNYITIIVNSIISSMLVGAALAIIVLAIFLNGYQAHPRGRHQHPAVRSVRGGAHVLYRAGPERDDPGRPFPRHWYAGG